MSEQPLVTIDAVAEHFAVSISTIRKWIREDRIPKSTYMKIGTTYRFKLESMTDAMIGGGERSPQLELSFEKREDDDDDDTDTNDAMIKLY